MERQRGNRPISFWIKCLLVAMIWVCLGAGCATVPPPHVAPPASAPASAAINQINDALTASAQQTPAASRDYQLGPEDLIQITLYNIPPGEAGVTPRTMEVRVSHEGNIMLPLLGDVPVTGMTTSVLEQSLRGKYDQYLHNPVVGVQVKEYRSQPVTVTGAVRNSGVYQLTGPKTLIDLLSLAGGLSDRAGGQVHVYRQGPDGRQSYVVDLLALTSNPALVNMPVQAGDVINVQQAGMFFVDGAVRNPGSHALTRPYTLTQALSVAGGVNRELADYSGTTIYRRGNGSEAEMLPVDLSAIWEGKAKDPQIESDDVIVVPISTAKYIVRRFIGTIGLGSVPGYTGF